jgi:hypothetical protein
MKRVSKIAKSRNPDGDIVQQKSPSIFSFQMVLYVLGLVGAVVLSVALWKRSQTAVQDLTQANADVLKEAMFGEVPYLFYCAKDSSNKADKDYIPSQFVEANILRSSTTGFAVLNCSSLLPSGKNIWERFKLKKIMKPAVFATAPWMKPAQVPMNHLKDASTLTKYIDTAMAPKPTEVKSHKDLINFCGFSKSNETDKRTIGPTCVVLMRGTRYAKLHADLEKKLVLGFPKVRVAAVNAAKQRLSYEMEGEYAPVENFALKVHALRNGTHYSTMVTPATWDYVNTFVSQMVGTPLYGFSGDAHSPVRLVKARSQADVEAAALRLQKKQERAAKKLEKEQQMRRQQQLQDREKQHQQQQQQNGEGFAAQMTPEEAEADKLRREREWELKRREAMDRMAQEQLFSAEEEGDEEGGGSSRDDSVGGADEYDGAEDGGDEGDEDFDGDDSVIEL